MGKTKPLTLLLSIGGYTKQALPPTPRLPACWTTSKRRGPSVTSAGSWTWMATASDRPDGMRTLGITVSRGRQHVDPVQVEAPHPASAARTQGETARPTRSEQELGRKRAKGRAGIEPPTPGFSVLQRGVA